MLLAFHKAGTKIDGCKADEKLIVTGGSEC